MKPGGVVSLKKINAFGLLHKNKLYVLMCVLLLVGMIIGSISISGSGSANSVFKGVFSQYISQRQDSGYFSVFLKSFLVYAVICLLYFSSGVSIIGVIISPIICCALGIYFSGIAAFSYSEFALKGVAFNAIILLPAALTFLICAFIAAKEAFLFSAVIFKLVLPKSHVSNISGNFKAYCGKYIIVLLLCLVSALIDAAVSVAFIKFFSF